MIATVVFELSVTDVWLAECSSRFFLQGVVARLRCATLILEVMHKDQNCSTADFRPKLFQCSTTVFDNC